MESAFFYIVDQWRTALVKKAFKHLRHLAESDPFLGIL